MAQYAIFYVFNTATISSPRLARMSFDTKTQHDRFGIPMIFSVFTLSMNIFHDLLSSVVEPEL